MDGGGVSGMSNFDAIPVTGARGDTSLIRKRGWHEKAVDRHGSITRVICPTVRSTQSRKTDATVHNQRARQVMVKVI